SEADSKARQQIRGLARRNPDAKTIVMGCYATRDPEMVAMLPNVVEVVPDKRELPDLFSRLGIDETPSGISRFDGHRRAFVKVQDGCILKCTYCIIPQVRPGLRSREPDEIEEEVRRLVDNGYSEIVLCGIHLGHFGVDTTRGKSGKAPFRLGHLIQKLDRIPGNWKLRLSSIEAAEVGTEFINMVADTERLCPHFHPSLQSGSNEILLRMRRRYRIGRFLEKIDQFRQRLDNPAFSTDVIVGFPGETDEDFEALLAFLEAARLDRVGAFAYS
ncbi:MAG: radical SAM protein, partial [Planctomycetaceae bacterium]|nr:radical SAM protein [Planctomycetaceae bacterium]